MPNGRVSLARWFSLEAPAFTIVPRLQSLLHVDQIVSISAALLCRRSSSVKAQSLSSSAIGDGVSARFATPAAGIHRRLVRHRGKQLRLRGMKIHRCTTCVGHQRCWRQLRPRSSGRSSVCCRHAQMENAAGNRSGAASLRSENPLSRARSSSLLAASPSKRLQKILSFHGLSSDSRPVGKVVGSAAAAAQPLQFNAVLAGAATVTHGVRQHRPPRLSPSYTSSMRLTSELERFKPWGSAPPEAEGAVSRWIPLRPSLPPRGYLKDSSARCFEKRWRNLLGALLESTARSVEGSERRLIF